MTVKIAKIAVFSLMCYQKDSKYFHIRIVTSMSENPAITCVVISLKCSLRLLLISSTFLDLILRDNLIKLSKT